MSTPTDIPYTFKEDLEAFAGEIKPESIVSRTVHKDDRIKATLFGFAAGQEMSEHTATRAAIIHILKGEAEVTVSGEHHETRAGAWFYLEPNTPHSLIARTEIIMLLTIIQA